MGRYESMVYVRLMFVACVIEKFTDMDIREMRWEEWQGHTDEGTIQALVPSSAVCVEPQNRTTPEREEQ